MKKIKPGQLSMFKDNLGFPLNQSSQNYDHTRKGGRPISNIRRPNVRRGSNNPNAYQGGGGGMPPIGEEGGRGEE